MSKKTTYGKPVIGILLLIALAVWLAVFSFPKKELRIIACDVGQGDAILITYGNFQILTDGGPNNRVVECLARHMPFWDRKVELVIMTHPEKDHYMGLIAVLESYNIGNFATTGLDSSNQEFQVLKKVVADRGIRVMRIVGGDKYRIGLIYLDILFPKETDILELASKIEDREKLSNLTGYETEKSKNNISLVYKLSYGKFDALFTADIEDKVSDKIAKELAGKPEIDWEYIKIPHHGSKNGISEKLLEVTSKDLPAGRQVAVISDGRNNSYGHPHKEVLDLLDKYKVQTFRTDLIGDVVVTTNGDSFKIN